MSEAHMDAKVLRRAAELVDQGHCQWYPALDEHGLSCSPIEPEAAAWCLTGAIERAAYELLGTNPRVDRERPDYRVNERLFRAVGGALRDVKPEAWPGPEWNNAEGRTADEVATVLRAMADRCDGVSPEPSLTATPA